MADRVSHGYPNFEPHKLTATDVFELSVDPSVIDLSEETLKALTMPSRRPQAIMAHLERQAGALVEMQGKIRDQLRRLQVEEQYLKKKLEAAPIEEDDIERPGVPMEVDFPADSKRGKRKTPTPTVVEPVAKIVAKKSVLSVKEEEDEEDEEEEEELPPSLRTGIGASYRGEDDDNYDDDDEDDAFAEMRKILASKR